MSAKKPKSGKKKTMADRADRHMLYEQAVQNVAEDCKFVSKTFRNLRGRKPRHMREDFCGTASMCCEWVRRSRHNTAVGVDLDAKVLAWGRKHNISRLRPEAQMRVSLIQDDVSRVQTTGPLDVVLAMNFSYQLLTTRKQLGRYLRQAHAALDKDGILFMDAFGGYEAYRETREKRKCEGFRYVWEQARYNPIDGTMRCYIHFGFPDGSKLNRAFAYDWRMWGLPELRELLEEAGFSRVTVYWEGTDAETGEGTNEFSPATVGDADPGWICFLVAEK